MIITRLRLASYPGPPSHNEGYRLRHDIPYSGLSRRDKNFGEWAKVVLANIVLVFQHLEST